MTKNPIVRRYYVAIRAALKTPLCISNGESEETDHDVIRNGSGQLFLPGTSIAGSIRDYLELQKNRAGAMGFSNDSEGRMSPIYVSDALVENGNVSIRDFVRLDRDKIAVDAGKFDMEIIESGAETSLFFEAVKRQDTSYNFPAIFQKILYGFQSGDIRLGSKKNRGFGWLAVEDARICSFDSDHLDQWIEFVPDWKEKIFGLSGDGYALKPEAAQSRFVDLTLPLHQEGGVIIRVYSAKNGKADFEHLHCSGEPVIPGSSWNGAIRQKAYEILTGIGCSSNAAEDLLEEWFGYVVNTGSDRETGGEPDACQSRVVYEESRIKGGNALTITRNKIDRFDAAVVGTALYTETAWFDGDTVLHIKVRRRTEAGKAPVEAVSGLMMLILDDLQRGYVSVGGQTGIGRGIFCAAGETDGAYGSGLNREECLRALYEYLSGKKVLT